MISSSLPLEEALKLAPVLFVVWRWRRSGTWTFGVTDLLLMGAAAGLGFGIVEDAYVRERTGSEPRGRLARPLIERASF